MDKQITQLSGCTRVAWKKHWTLHIELLQWKHSHMQVSMSTWGLMASWGTLPFPSVIKQFNLWPAHSSDLMREINLWPTHSSDVRASSGRLNPATIYLNLDDMASTTPPLGWGNGSASWLWLQQKWYCDCTLSLMSQLVNSIITYEH